MAYLDLISREAAIEALGERPENRTDSPEEIEAVRAYDNAIDNLKNIPSVSAVPLEPLCKYLELFTTSPLRNMHYHAAWWKEVLKKIK